MALEFLDGWDHYNSFTNMRRKWSDVGSSFGSFNTGRFAGQCFRSDGGGTNIRLDLPALAERVVGFAVMLHNASSTQVVCAFRDSGSTQVDVRYTGNVSQTLQVTRNGTVLGTTTATFAPTPTWHYLEFKAKIDPSAGTFTLRMNGVSVLSMTGQNTRNTANSSANQLMIAANSGSSSEISYDDLYVCNMSGSVNNDLIGECRIFTVLPNADAATIQWTPNSGTAHFSRVNESNPDDDSSYVSDSTAGHIDLYGLPDIAPTGSIAAVQVTLTARKDDVGTREIASQCKSGATSDTGATIPLTTTYAMYRQIRETDPATGVAWTASGFNSAEFGAKVIT